MLKSASTSLLFGALILCISCTPEVQHNEEQAPPPSEQHVIQSKEDIPSTEVEIMDSCLYSFQLNQWSSEFYYVDPIHVFTIDSIDHFESKTWVNIDDLEDCVTPILGELKRHVFQDSTLDYSNDTILYDDTGFLYTIQRIRPYSFGIVIEKMNDGWVEELNYFSYTSKGCLLDQFTLAATGGDGGYHTEGSGYFENDSTYIYTEVESLSLATGKLVEIQRTKSKHIIQFSGAIQDTILENREFDLPEEERP